MYLKICGLTRAVDVPPALAAGATHIGMIFAEGSPRQVSLDEAAPIRAAIPASVAAVGVFRGQSEAEIARIATELRLDAVQLHGGYPDESIGALKQQGIPVIWAIPVSPDGRWQEPTQRPDLYLLDTQKAGAFGGTGTRFDWSSAPRPQHPFLVAGGVTPYNLGHALTALSPDGFDIGSSVEAAPGIKSHERLRALGHALRALNHGTAP